MRHKEDSAVRLVTRPERVSMAGRRPPAAGARQGLLTARGEGSTRGRLTGSSGLGGTTEVKVGGLGSPRPRDEPGRGRGPSARSGVAWKCPPPYPQLRRVARIWGCADVEGSVPSPGPEKATSLLGQCPALPGGRASLVSCPLRQQDHQHHPHCPVHPSSFFTSWQRVRRQGQWGSCPLPVTPQSSLPPRPCHSSSLNWPT